MTGKLKEVMMKKHRALLACSTAFAVMGNAWAGSIPVTAVYTHNEKDNFGGLPIDMINGSGMNGNPQTGGLGWPTTAPSTWTATNNGYQSEWQSQDLLAAQSPSEDLNASGVLVGSGVNPGTNNKIGWAIFDLGSVYALDDLYIWHIRETSTRVATNFNVLVSSSPTATPVHGPTGNNSRDYDFSSGGWSAVSTGLVGTYQGSQVVDLTGNNGRYVAIEIISNGGDVNRVGFAEIGITQAVATAIPSPSAALAGLLGLGALVVRRRRGGANQRVK